MAGIVILCLLFAGIAVMVFGFIKRNDSVIPLIGGGILFLLSLIIIFGMSIRIIDAGEIGVQVEFGEVKKQVLSEGFNFKSIFADVFIYNTRLNEYTMTRKLEEGDKTDPDTVSARTKDNSNVTIDVTIWWAVNPEDAPMIYKKYSKNIEGLKSMIIRPALRSAIRDKASEYTLEMIMKQRDDFSLGVIEKLNENIKGKGIVLDKVLVRGIDPPETVNRAIEAKLKAEQELQQKEFELEKAKKDAEIQRIKAQGTADAQDIIQKKLTPIYVQYEAIQAYKELAGSENTTFVILPTSPQGAGMPLILNSK